MANPTLLDIAIANGSDAVVGLVDETIKAVPELQVGAARTIRGLNFKTWVRTALPGVSFRAANSGTAATKGTYENRLVETFIFNPRWEADKAVADSYEDGASAFIAVEAMGVMESSMQFLGGQFYYGLTNDALGFPGLLAMHDSTNMVVDAGGTTDNVASSAWLVKFGPQDVQWVWGNAGQLALSPLQEQRVLDGSSNPFTAYVQEILARPGLQFNRKFSACRIKKLTTDAGKGLTDALISQALSKFPVSVRPDYIFCSRRSLQQLQASRTATNVTGAPAPIPDESFGVPILPTDSIKETETLAS